MKKQLIAALFATSISVMSVTTLAAEPQGYGVDTELGALLENPETAAVIEKHFPGLANADGISMAGQMSLRDLQQFKADLFTDKALQETEADLKKITPKK